MDLAFKVKHYANKILFTFLGPADLDEQNDPIRQLNRQWEERFGSPKPVQHEALTAGDTAQTPRAIA